MKMKKISDKANILNTLNKYNRMTFLKFLPIRNGISKYNQRGITVSQTDTSQIYLMKCDKGTSICDHYTLTDREVIIHNNI